MAKTAFSCTVTIQVSGEIDMDSMTGDVNSTTQPFAKILPAIMVPDMRLLLDELGEDHYRLLMHFITMAAIQRAHEQVKLPGVQATTGQEVAIASPGERN